MRNRGPARVFPQLHDGGWLAEAVAAGKTGAQLAAEIGCSQPALYQAVRKHDIKWPQRGHPKLRDERWLREQYLEAELGCESIAAELDVSAQAVKDALKRIGIDRRSQLEARRARGRRYRKRIVMPEARELYEAEATLNDLAARYGVDAHIVREVLVDAGVQIRTRAEQVRIVNAKAERRRQIRQTAERRRRPTGVRGLKTLLAQDAVCAFCGEPDEIHGHHLNSVRSDHRPENLVPLCRDCHTKVEWLIHHATEGLRRAYRGEEPDLRLPA